MEAINKFRVGVIWGAGIGGIETFQNEVINFCSKGMEHRVSTPFLFQK